MIAAKRVCTILALILCHGLRTLSADVAPVSENEAAAWTDHLIPLPHEISIPQKALVAPADVAITLRSGADDVERQALADLQALFNNRTGKAPSGTAFQILIGVSDGKGGVDGVAVGGFKRLRECPHNDQAYVIEPQGASRLVVTGLDSKGVYYGVQTLCQLLEPKMSPEQIAIPLATVVDWPDMDERGLWNHDLDMIPWIASLKLNFSKVPSHPAGPVKRGEPVRAKIRAPENTPNILEAARLRALKAVPNVSHLNYIGGRSKAYEAYPELAGKGDAAVPDCGMESRNIRLPCGASPVLKQIITEYMTDLAGKGAQEISVWLSEHQAQCQCAPCLEAGQFRMETRAAVEAWQEVRKQYPHVVLRIFYCMGGKSSEDTYDCLMALPPAVKIERCYGHYGQAFHKAAAEGRWLASYAGPSLARAECSGMRFYGASHTKDYVQDHHKRNWSGIYSINYVYSSGAYQRALYDFHIGALAEWTWNLKGRSVRDYARAWATRAGYPQPDKVAEWVALMDPIERQMAASLAHRTWAKVPERIRNRQAPLRGADIFPGFRTAQDFDERIGECRRALELAKELGHKELILETQYVMSYVQSLKSLHELLTQVSSTGAPEKQASRTPQAILDDFSKAVATMIDVMDGKTDLLKAEPASFAESTKKKHAEMWQGRLKGITAAVSELK